MGYIVVDTETTGLFRHHNKRPDDGTFFTARSDEPGQPRMAEFAAVLLDDEFNVEGDYQQYILPIGWMNAEEGKDGMWHDTAPMLEMPEEAFNVHHLSMEFLTANGLPVKLALDYYLRELEAGRIPVGFNMQHDGRQMRGELRRAGMPDLFDTTPNICAMRSMQASKMKVKKLNGKGGFPRLIDVAAHFNVPGYTEDKHHQATDDVRATAFIAKCLNEHGKLLPAAVHYAKGMST